MNHAREVSKRRACLGGLCGLKYIFAINCNRWRWDSFRWIFFSNSTFKKKNPTFPFSIHPAFSSMQISGEKSKNELKKVDFLLLFCSFEFRFSFSGVPDGALASTSTTLLYYPG